MLGKTCQFYYNQKAANSCRRKSGKTPFLFDSLNIDNFFVSPLALSVPDIDTYLGLMHTLFALEDMYGLRIDKINETLCLRLEQDKEYPFSPLLDRFRAWQRQAEKLDAGKITKEEYDRWRYTYPQMEVEKTKRNLDALREKQHADIQDKTV